MLKQVDPKTFAQVEFEQACESMRTWAAFRRQGLLFVSAAQGAILAYFGSRYKDHITFDVNAFDIALSALAFCVAVIGLLHELRVKVYYDAFREYAASKIGDGSSDNLVGFVQMTVKTSRSSISNKITHRTYYVIVMAFWIYAWLYWGFV